MVCDILIVDDEPDIRTLLCDILQDEGHSTREADDADSAFTEVSKKRPSLIILDIWLQGSRMDGIEILKSVKKSNPEIPVVIISGHANIEIAVAAIKKGAYDFIQKPFQTEQLLITVNRALEKHKLRCENESLKFTHQTDVKFIGRSSEVCQIRSTLNRIASASSRILITGSVGTGKEHAARYLHAHSPRAHNTFVSVNAASLSPSEMEAALFGKHNPDGTLSIGLFEKADGGTLFIDEVTEIPLLMQSKILRVLLDQSFKRVGGTENIHVDMRIISATTKNFTQEIENGRFREDLYHRLNVVPITLPSLADRRDDIPALVEHFVEHFNIHQGLQKRNFSPDALAVLQTHAWPGNVRQLRNVVEHVLILSKDSPQNKPVQVDELPQENPSSSDVQESSQGISKSNIISLTLREAREVFERDYLLAQINRFNGNISRTAAFIGMERSALHRKLKALGITPMGRANSEGDEEIITRQKTA